MASQLSKQTWFTKMHLMCPSQVTYSNGLRHFTVHAYPSKKKSFGLCCFSRKSERTQKDFRFLATTPDEAVQWVSGLAEQHCFVNLQAHPLVSSKKQPSDFVINETIFDQPAIKRRSTPRILVILNPRSGHGRSSKVFHNKVEPIFKVYFDTSTPCSYY